MTDDNQQLRMKRFAARAAHLALAKHCVAFISDIRAPAWELASGTLVKIGTHLLVCTASHTIPNAPNGRLWLLPPRPRRASEGMLGVLRFGRTVNDFPDVAYLEISSRDAEIYLSDEEPLGIDRLGVFDPNQGRRLVLLLGYPGGNVPQEEIEQNRTVHAISLGYATSTLFTSEWPQSLPSNAVSVNPDVDFFLQWEEDAANTVNMDTGEPVSAPHPAGTSGGGLWDFTASRNDIWSPDSARLIGIQSRTGISPSFGRYVRLMQIVHWLRMLYRDYEDVRAELVDHFGATVAQ